MLWVPATTDRCLAVLARDALNSLGSTPSTAVHRVAGASGSVLVPRLARTANSRASACIGGASGVSRRRLAPITHNSLSISVHRPASSRDVILRAAAASLASTIGYFASRLVIVDLEFPPPPVSLAFDWPAPSSFDRPVLLSRRSLLRGPFFGPGLDPSDRACARAPVLGHYYCMPRSPSSLAPRHIPTVHCGVCEHTASPVASTGRSCSTIHLDGLHFWPRLSASLDFVGVLLLRGLSTSVEKRSSPPPSSCPFRSLLAFFVSRID